MVLIAVRCPFCQSDHIIKGGKTETGKQRYRCQSVDYPRRSFVLAPAYQGRMREIKQQVIDMSLNGNGIRDTARVLKISPTTVMNELKKRACARSGQHASGGGLAVARGSRARPHIMLTESGIF